MNETLHRRNPAAFFALALLAASCRRQAPDHVVKVTVRDAEFRVLSMVSAPEQLLRFEQIWVHKEAQDATIDQGSLPSGGYVLDVRSSSGVHRWIYNPKDGTLTIVAVKASTPTYRVLERNAFNVVIGVQPQ